MCKLQAFLKHGILQNENFEVERYSNSDRRNKGRMDQLYTKFQQIIIYFLNAHIGRYYSDLNEIFLRLFAKQ